MNAQWKHQPPAIGGLSLSIITALFASVAQALMIALTLGLVVIKQADAAVISFSDVGRAPAFGVSGEDWYFTLSLDSRDAMHAGDQLKIPFLPWVGYRPFPSAAIVEQFQSSSGETLPGCQSLHSPFLCAHTSGFMETPGHGDETVFAETIFTPLTIAAFEALKIQCPACVERGRESLGIVQTTFTYIATSDITGPILNLAFFQAHFPATTNPPPAPVYCPTVKLVDSQGNLLRNSLGDPSLNVDCEFLVSEPHVLGGAPLAILILDLEGPPSFLPLRDRGGHLPECLRALGEPICAFVAVAAIPEPTSMLLGLSGFVALMVMRLGRPSRGKGRVSWIWALATRACARGARGWN